MPKNNSRTGYVKDWRQELDSDIWLMPPLYQRVWQWLKYQVNHIENEIPMTDGTKFKIMPGQHLTSLRNIAKGVGWMEGRAWKEPNPKTIKKILEWLDKNSMITQTHGRGNREYTLITLIKWDVYQAEIDRGNAKVTRKKQLVEQGVEQGVDINNNDREIIKNVKKKDIGAFVEFANGDAELLEALMLFEQMRIDKKKPMTPGAQKLLINKLVEFRNNGEDIIECLKTSVINSWLSIYPSKDKKYGKSKRVELITAYPSHSDTTELTEDEEINLRNTLSKL